MPKTLNRAQATYAPGLYGPFKVDNFTKNDTQRLACTFTIPPGGWPPAADPLFRITFKWHDALGNPLGGMSFAVAGDQGARTEGTVFVDVPRVGDSSGKVDVADGTVEIEVFDTFTTAITLAAQAS